MLYHFAPSPDHSLQNYFVHLGFHTGRTLASPDLSSGERASAMQIHLDSYENHTGYLMRALISFGGFAVVA